MNPDELEIHQGFLLLKFIHDGMKVFFKLASKIIIMTITQDKIAQDQMTPEKALNILKEGNARFASKSMINRNLMEQVEKTSTGQYPYATILGCIDSRVPAEQVFDVGIGDIFNIRIAGNFVNEDILGSMEFATKLAGTKVIVVLGHTLCGAIKGACDDAKLGNLTGMLAKLMPAVKSVPNELGESSSANTPFVLKAGELNVHQTVENIRNMSPVIADMESKGELKIVGAMYDIATGKVEFYA